MKKYFLTGLVLLLPLALTIIIVVFVINILTKPFVGIVSTAFDYYDLFNKPILFFSGSAVLMFVSKIVALVSLIVVIMVIGCLAQLVILRVFGRVGDYFLHRIPLVSPIYKATQDVVHTLLAEKTKDGASFSSVVLAPFPHEKTRSIGLVTHRALPEGSDIKDIGKISVFVPGTPNPSMGFMLMFREDQLIHLDMRVDEALKLLVSIGVIWPEFPPPIQQDISAK